MQTYALHVPGQAADVTLHPRTNGHGQLIPTTDRHGDGWLAALDVVIHGERGAILAGLTLLPGMARDLAHKLTRQADFAEALARGDAGPCLCTAWTHNLAPGCPNAAALDYSMCRDCWTPGAGQSGLTMAHGAGREEAIA